MSVRQTVHAYGFSDKAVAERVGLCDGETPHQAFERIRSNIEHFGGEVVHVKYMWPLGESRESATAIQFDAPAHDDTAGMWHLITVASEDEWRAKP